MKKKKFSRVYRRYQEWEEIKFNMWGTVKDRNKFLDLAVVFTGNHKRYGRYMNRVVQEWTVSCENALTDLSINRKAWLGHAACALALKCPEDIVREAWKILSDEQRLLANEEARKAIEKWEVTYRKRKKIY